MLHLALVAALLGQEMSGPEYEVPIGRLEIIRLTDVTEEEWNGADIDTYPKGYKTELIGLYGKQEGSGSFYPVILFRALEDNPNKQYDLVVTYTKEGRHARLFYTIKTGKAPQPPPVDPDDPEVETEGPVTAVLFCDPVTVSGSEQLGQLLIDARDFSTENDGYFVRIFSRDAEDEQGRPVPNLQPFIQKLPEEDIPYGFVTRKKVGADSEKIMWQGELTTADALIAVMKEAAGD